MKVNIRRASFLLLLFISLSWYSCDEIASPELNIDPEFQPYVDEFVRQASLRGVDVDFEETGMSIQFDALTAANANGICYGVREEVTSDHEIVIHRNNWQEAGPAARERLIFHELGHCYLYRRHTNDTLANGEWKSLLTGPPWPDYKYWRGTNYTNRRKEYYIDELFNPGTPAPEWSFLEEDYDAVTQEQKIPLLEMEGNNTVYRSTDLSGDFEIELMFTIPPEVIGNSITLAWGGLSLTSSHRISLSNWDIIIADDLISYGLIKRLEFFFDGLNFGEPNKITVRKRGAEYYYFVNEKFIYWSDYSPLVVDAVRISTNGQYNGSSISLKVYKISD